MTIRKSTQLKKITLKWWHDWFVIFRITEAGKTHWAFPYSLISLLDLRFKLGEITFINIMLYYGLFTWKGNCYCSFTDVFIAVATNIHNKVSFNIECFKNFLSFSPTLFTIFEALLTLCTLTSACQFSILFSIHFIMCWQGEFVFNNQEVL